MKRLLLVVLALALIGVFVASVVKSSKEKQMLRDATERLQTVR